VKARDLFGVVVLLLLLPLSGLTSLAYASPPDPSWIRGIYDGADCDDVVVLVTSSTALTAAWLVDQRQPSPLIGAAPLHADAPVPVRSTSPRQSRAPPAS